MVIDQHRRQVLIQAGFLELVYHQRTKLPTM